MEDLPIYNNVQYLEYSINPEIYQQIVKAVDESMCLTGIKPYGLLLGYGTYFSLCLTLSQKWGATELLKPVEFQGMRIIIDPGYEHRIRIVVFENAWEEAFEAFSANVKERTVGIIPSKTDL